MASGIENAEDEENRSEGRHEASNDDEASREMARVVIAWRQRNEARTRTRRDGGIGATQMK